jgi:hypothetical protein
MFAVLEFVNRTAIGALGLARVAYVQIHLGVAAPGLHVCQRVGAKHATLVVQVFGQ